MYPHQRCLLLVAPTYVQHHQLVLSWLASSLTPNVLSVIVNKVSAADAWKTPQGRCASSSHNRVLQLRGHGLSCISRSYKYIPKNFVNCKAIIDSINSGRRKGDLSDGDGQSNVGDGVGVGVVVRGVVTPTDTANHKLAAQGFLKLGIAALIFKAAYQFMEAKGSWEMNEVNRTEEAIPTRYYCYRCRHVVTVDVEMKCPFCQGGFIQACEGVALLYVAMASESGSDVESTIGIYDSNPSGFVTLGIGSQDVNNEVDEQRHEIRATSSEWILLLANLGLEILSAAFDQVSSPRKPHYAIIGMLLAIVAVLACISELLHNGIKERVVLRRRGMLWCFYYPPPNNFLFGTFPEIFGLGLAIVQHICSAVKYYFLHRHATNPIKLSPVPAVFFFGLVVLKLVKNRRYTADDNLQNGT